MLKDVEPIVVVCTSHAAITQRKINLSSLDLRRAIEQCDAALLPGEYAELLLKFIPSKDEVSI